MIYIMDQLGERGFQLPIIPEDLEPTIQSSTTTVKILESGDHSIITPKGLLPLEWASFFPAKPTHLSQTSFQPPDYYREFIESRQGKEPIRFIYTGKNFDLNLLMTIESFSLREAFGDEDLNYRIKLREYKPPIAVKMKIVPASTKGPKKPDKIVEKKVPERPDPIPPKTYVMVSGDTLWKIAQRFTRSGNNYPVLQKLNGIRDDQLTRLPIGLKLKIPPEWS